MGKQRRKQGLIELLAVSRLFFSGAGFERWVWTLLTQLVLAAGYAFVFGGLLGLMGGMADYVPFLLCGLGPWFYYEKVISTAVEAPVLFLKVPAGPGPGILCGGAVLSAVFLHILWLCLALVAAGMSGQLSVSAFAAPLYVVLGMLNALAQGLMGAAFVPLFGEVGKGILASMAVVFWTTPVIWPVELLPAAARLMMRVNPLYYVTEGLRGCLLYGRVLLSLEETLWFLGITVLTGGMGLFCMGRLNRYYREAI